MKASKTISEFICNIRMEDYPDDCIGKQALLPNKQYILKITYPFNKPKEFKIKTGKSGMKFEDVLKKVCAIYQDLYKEPDKNGVWGHSHDQLFIEGIIVNHKEQTIKLLMGS